ncbi:MAG: hypothetical protein GY940_25955, partial [bacterium]|nr:hypothetical protein [bacterium]
CPVEDTGGYTGFEHHLYRVEIAQTKKTEPMFKWSRFNGGLVGRGEFDIPGKKVGITANFQAITTSGLTSFYLETVQYDEDLGHWRVTYGINVTLNADNELDLTGTPFYGDGTLLKPGEPVFFRLWDGIKATAKFPPSDPTANPPVEPKELIDGIQLEFDNAAGKHYRPGDYWTFKVRAGGLENNQ